MKMEMICRRTESGRELHKVVELAALPRVGDRMAVECEMGCIVLEVQDMLWQEGHMVRLFCRPRPLGRTSFGDVVLDAAGWETTSPESPAPAIEEGGMLDQGANRNVVYEVYVDGTHKHNLVLNSGISVEDVLGLLKDNNLIKVGDEATVSGWHSGASTFRVDVRRPGGWRNFKIELVEVVR